MSQPFRGPLVRVRRNRWVMALAASPLLVPLGLALGLSGPGSGQATLAVLLQTSILALFLTFFAWRKNPWPRRDVVEVAADARTLTVAGAETPRERLNEGFVVPAVGETKVVLHQKGLAPPVELVAQGVPEARSVLLALGFDASQTVARSRTLSRLLGEGRIFFVIGPLVGLFFAVARLRFVGSALLPAAVLVLVLALISLWPTTLTVGADGVEVRWLGSRRFIRHRDIVNATMYESGLGNSRYLGVALTLESGEEIRLPVSQARSDADRTRMILERIHEAAAEAERRHVELDPALLARGDRDVGDWMRALRSLGAGANATMRTAPVEADRLWRIVEDPAGAPITRAAAAVALTADPAADSRRRLRAAAEATAAPRLRIAIDAAAAHDEDALKEALAELEAEDEESRANTSS
jgi:hypothetical protein